MKFWDIVWICSATGIVTSTRLIRDTLSAGDQMFASEKEAWAAAAVILDAASADAQKAADDARAAATAARDKAKP